MTFAQYVKQNAVSFVTLQDEDTVFSTCDATGEAADCLPVTVQDTKGRTWSAEFNKHDVIDWLNAE